MKRISIAALLFLLSGSAALAGGPEGYYKDVFMDSGIHLTSRVRLPASERLGLRMEKFVSASHKKEDGTAMTQIDTALQKMILCGSPIDENGILLYPDGSPRFRVVYMNGGKAMNHSRSLTETGRDNIRKFVENGGSYVGTCAGAYLACKYTYRDSLKLNPLYMALWPGTTSSCRLENSWTDMTVPADSPLLKYYDFGGDFQIDSVRHNGGNYANLEHECPDGTEVLALFDTRGRADISYDLTSKPSIWARKASPSTGRVISCGSHPESHTSGERLDLMCAMLLYAMEGNAAPSVKASLKPGDRVKMTRRSCDNDPEHTKIGDLQYHHFMVDVPEGGATVVLSSLKGWTAFDLHLYATTDSFAFASNSPLCETSEGVAKALHISEPGTWHVSVYCATTVDATETAYGTMYSGRIDVLNGVPYILSVK